MRLPLSPRTALAIGLAALLSASGIACTDRRAATDSQPLRVYAATPEAVAPVGNVPEDIETLSVTIANGEFQADVYSAQTSPTRMIVTTQGGPYVLAIQGVLGPEQLPANGAKEVDLTLPNPGEYRMTLSGNADDIATLNVRPLGTR